MTPHLPLGFLASLVRPSHWALLAFFALGCPFLPSAAAAWLGIATAAAIVAEVLEINIAARNAAAAGAAGSWKDAVAWYRPLHAADGSAAFLSALAAFVCLLSDDGLVAAIFAAQAGLVRVGGLVCALMASPRRPPVLPKPEGGP